MKAVEALTIAIPTYNRADYVEAAIASLRQQRNETDRWRVVVVDNNSDDDTVERLASMAAAWSRLVVVGEPRPGASHARNRALHETPTGYILYVDDECRFPDDYVDRALRIIDQRSPCMFGGPIYPWYVTPPPKWFRTEYGSYSVPWATGRAGRISLSAGNLGFSVAALRDVQGFDPELGPSGGVMAYGEETELEDRIIRRFGGELVHYDPEFVNFHAVRPEKYNWRNMVRENFLRGVGRAMVEDRCKGAGPIDIPDCLKPCVSMPPSVAQDSMVRADVLAFGFGLVRRAGYYWARARRQGRSHP